MIKRKVENKQTYIPIGEFVKYELGGEIRKGRVVEVTNRGRYYVYDIEDVITYYVHKNISRKKIKYNGEEI